MNKILLVCETLHLGGAERQVVSDANLLAAHGWDVTLAYWTDGDLARKLTPEVNRFFIKSKGWAARLVDLYTFCRQHPFDLIHSHLTGANLLASVAGRLAHRPVIVTEHGLGLWRRKEIKFRIAVAMTYRLANRITAVCEATRKVKINCEGANPQRTLVIHNCFDASSVQEESSPSTWRQKYRIPPDAKVIGFAGRLVQVKRLDLLVSIASQVVAQAPHAVFLIVGDGTHRSQLQAIINKSRLAFAFRFAGMQMSIAPFYKMMDVFVLTSEREAFSVALLEASASGLPAVVFDVGGNSEIVLHNSTGYLVPFGDCDQFATYLVELLTNDDLRDHMGRQARSRAQQKFSPEARLDALEALYSAVLSQVAER